MDFMSTYVLRSNDEKPTLIFGKGSSNTGTLWNSTNALLVSGTVTMTLDIIRDTMSVCEVAETQLHTPPIA